MRNLVTIVLGLALLALIASPAAASHKAQSISAMKKAVAASNEIGKLVKKENEFYTYFYWRYGRILLRYSLRFHLRGNYRVSTHLAHRSWSYTTYPKRSALWWRSEALDYLKDSSDDTVPLNRNWISGLQYVRTLYQESTDDFGNGAFWYARNKACTIVDKLTHMHQLVGNTATGSAARTYVQKYLQAVQTRHTRYNAYFDRIQTTYVRNNRVIPTSLLKDAFSLCRKGNIHGALYMGRMASWRVGYVSWVNWIHQNRARLQKWVAAGVAHRNLNLCFNCYIGWCLPGHSGHLPN